jgi:hypothetical protein
MAIIVHFHPTGMNASQYEQVLSLLREAGLGAPKGRLYHACYGAADELRVVDVYDSPQSFEAFGQSLIPLLVEHGIDIGQPVVEEVHNLILG